MTQSSCKRDTKSKSHPGMRLAPVRVFSCKYPLLSDRKSSHLKWSLTGGSTILPVRGN